VLDAQMPNLDVKATVRQLRARSPRSRIVLLSLDSGTLANDLRSQMALIVGMHEGSDTLLAAILAPQARMPVGNKQGRRRGSRGSRPLRQLDL
jgi:hypothetical protein